MCIITHITQFLQISVIRREHTLSSAFKLPIKYVLNDISRVKCILLNYLYHWTTGGDNSVNHLVEM